ncbi:hypothetical protein WMY93_003578 [Mugilogobius chulae]|uniref:Phosphoinositide 3-kinase regulatory subunit 5 n=1 Tax=Mugilogobius chulae TaxID=88201 RepID=A0AAW0Q6W2_9GOBI
MESLEQEQSSCTEDRIEHVLERCLCDLGLDTPNKQLWNAGLCINRWCLEELVKRNSENFVILLNKILLKTKEVLERFEYDLVVPLTLLFSSTLLKAPHVPADSGLLQEAYSLFHCFLSWPEPCSSACFRLLLTIQQELRAPGTIKGLVLPLPKCLMRTWENDSFDFLHDIVIGDECDPDSIEECFLNGDLDDSLVEEEDETVANQQNDFLNNRISTVSTTSRDSVFSNLSLSSSWSVSTLSCTSGVDSDISDEQGHDEPQKQRKKPKKKSKSFLGVERFSLLFKAPRSPLLCRRTQSINSRSDLSKNKPLSSPSSGQTSPSAAFPQTHLRRRPILSCDLTDEPEQVVQVRVVVFGGDKELGRLARAYTDLQQRDSKHGPLKKRCKLYFYFVPTKRQKVETPALRETADNGSTSLDLVPENSSNIAHMLGMVDPWYERNVLSLLSLSSDILCQSACKESDESLYSDPTVRPSLLAEMVLYYCRHAAHTVLVQLYKAELTLAGGEKRVEVFVHLLELGHSAGTRAVKAMGAVSKRFGIDDEQEAAPLALNIGYNKITISGRSQWIEVDTVCTSVNVLKSVENMKCLFCISEMKVDYVQVQAGSEGTTFAVCLDQDEKKFFQSVVRCEVSLCSKPCSSSDWKTFKICPGQVQPLHPSYRSLLCLPLCSFCPSQR